MSTATKRVLPADVYDALELSALAYGGIGANEWVEGGAGFGYGPQDVPWCVKGHANACDPDHDAVTSALDAALIFVVVNDEAVTAINERRGAARNDRVPFADWCAELGVERGA